MALSILFGGARSGKSTIAAEIAARHEGDVVFIATAEARDDEMARRIESHRAHRPADWVTIEEAIDLQAAMESAPEDALVLVDCLTLWVSNLIEKGLEDPSIEDLAQSSAAAAAGRIADTIVVSNEVGSGIVPMNELARRYRDLMGRVNSIWAAAAHRSVLVVAGRVIPLHAPEVLWNES
jgi:adenosylcobinamide kinase/adenosylcobinamide-phosphate guanylyltransferase